MIFEILENKLVDAGLGVKGVSLFRNFMPADCQIGVLFRTPLTGVDIDPYIEGWHKDRMQAIVRHVDPVLGEDMAHEVIKTLLVNTPEIYPETPEYPETHISLFFPMAEPIQFPLLEGNCIEWSLNFKMAYGHKPRWK